MCTLLNELLIKLAHNNEQPQLIDDLLDVALCLASISGLDEGE